MANGPTTTHSPCAAGNAIPVGGRPSLLPNNRDRLMGGSQAARCLVRVAAAEAA
jgi:hypothetical protein